MIKIEIKVNVIYEFNLVKENFYIRFIKFRKYGNI